MILKTVTQSTQTARSRQHPFITPLGRGAPADQCVECGLHRTDPIHGPSLQDIQDAVREICEDRCLDPEIILGLLGPKGD